MKLFMLFIFLGISGICRSQVIADSPKRGAQALKDSLLLNEQQEKALLALNVKFFSEMSLIDKSTVTPQQKGEKRKQLLEWHNNELKKIFTVSQYQKYKSIVSSNRIISEEKKKNL